MINIKRFIFLITLVSCVFYSDNTIAQKINQFNAQNQRTGLWRKYYSNQSIRYEGNFENGKEVGVFKFYDKDNYSFPVIIKRYSKTSDSVNVEFYTKKGWLQSKGKFLDKSRVGLWEYFFEDGKILSTEEYHQGKLHGELKNYYPNGKITEHTIYRNGMKNGFSRKYSSDGILIEEVHYKNDLLDGLAKYFELNGNLKERGSYKAGKKARKWEYFMDGEVVDKEKAKDKNQFKKNKQ